MKHALWAFGFALQAFAMSHAHAEGAPTPLKILAFSDFNLSTTGNYNRETKEIVALLSRSQPDAILAVGDLIDGEKKNLTDHDYDRMWASFNRSILDPIRLSQVPLFPSPGNHDATYPIERKAFASFWLKNGQKDETFLDKQHYPFRYSFQIGGVFFISLDDAKYESLFDREEQLRWLAGQLQSPEARNSRARIVFGHIPLYSVATIKAGSNEIYKNGELRKERRVEGPFTLEQILIENQVDLVVFGHSHAYYAGDYIYRDGKRLPVISLPCAGGSRRYLAGTEWKSPYGYVEIQISSSNKLTYQFLDALGSKVPDTHLPKTLTLDASTGVMYAK